eukprot:1387032-Prorocentrum_lima.AAC.1
MTSSLVGSEMCIRDRLIDEYKARGWGIYDPALSEGPRHEILERREIPVSYTHLTLPTICSV